MINNFEGKRIRKISAKIPIVNEELAKAYIQGAVHSHCNNSADKAFSVRILFGGNNRDWTDTPLQCIYDYHNYIKKATDPAKEAAKDVGWLLQRVLMDDQSRGFDCLEGDTGCHYKLSL